MQLLGVSSEDEMIACLALGAPTLGLVMWCAQSNGHGLVTVYGFVLGALVWAALHRVLHPERSLRQPLTATA
ncbi:hypothetical protein [Streptacidiphilus rugosus]|uniref:hypothetical protein n=1 Tax=Streptacidiphilus rugosus TaxID=405783 RepID=UPI00056B3B51|nr:hypothetical protein [Streptacidiphilus rugosus]